MILEDQLLKCSAPLTPYKCSFCYCSTNYLVYQNRHSCYCSYEEPIYKSFYCKNCAFEAASILSHLRHYITCKYRQIWKCLSCSHTTTNKINLQRHTYLCHTAHELIKWYECDQCEYRAKAKTTLNNHKFAKHTQVDTSNLLKCSQCSFQTKYRLSLRRHGILIHVAKAMKQFECDECNFSSRYKTSLSHHKLHKHVSSSIWICAFCSYRTNRKCDFDRHLISKHTPDEELQWYTCEQCDYTTKIKRNLKRHQSKHDGTKKIVTVSKRTDKEFKCRHCTYKSNRCDNLKEHILAKHTSSENVDCWFVCGHCQFKSKMKRYLKRHIATKHYKAAERCKGNCH